MGENAVAGSDMSGQSYPPGQYKLEDVSISVRHQTGHRLPGSYEITISGDGKATRTTDQKQRTVLALSKDTRLELLNDFYRIHFFELSDTYTRKRYVGLLDDDVVSTFSSRLVDMNSQRLCIGIADYKKCVTIMDGRPLEASQLVKKIEALFTTEER